MQICDAASHDLRQVLQLASLWHDPAVSNAHQKAQQEGREEGGRVLCSKGPIT